MWRSEGGKGLPAPCAAWAEFRAMPRDRYEELKPSAPPPPSSAVKRPGDVHLEEDSQANEWIRAPDEEEHNEDVNE